jgi:hypothetical protein
VLAVQAGYIPETVQSGLSPEVQKAIEPACAFLFERTREKSVMPSRKTMKQGDTNA